MYTGLGKLQPSSRTPINCPPLTGLAKILTAAIGAPKYLDWALPPTFRLSWRCPKKQGWQYLQFFQWSAHNPWTRLSPSRIKPMRPGIPLRERIRCTHILLGQRRCGEACGERCEKKPTGNFPIMSFGARICVRESVRKKNGLQANYP